LFDAGPGLRNIADIVRQLTQLPIRVLPSHLHFDHVGGLHAFKGIALPDLPDLRRQAVGNRLTLRREQHLGYLDAVSPPTIMVNSWITPGSEIELGGRSVRVVSVPGHTPDSVALMDQSGDRIFIFAGDFIYPDTLFAFLPGADLKAYRDSARNILSLTTARTILYGAHGCEERHAVEAPNLARSDLEAMERTLSGVVEGSLKSTGLFPRHFSINDRMWLWAKYQWMR
jgi:glyoxylase-like metal-dependent hydrolase (beta-lactamase superfamily II)